MLQTYAHVLEIKHRREDLQGRIMIYYRLACRKRWRDRFALSFPIGMPKAAVETQLQAGEDPPAEGDVSGGSRHPCCVFDLVFVSIAASRPFAQCPRSSSARR